jgi:ABC-type phosphate transport system substrate-binding protein
MRVLYQAAIAGAAVVALAGLGVGGAAADPYQPPAPTDIVGVGADTAGPLFDGGVSVKDAGTFVTDYNATSPASKLWSWEAVGSPSIAAKPGCAAIPRPEGSDEGIDELNANAKFPNGDFCIDFAASSRAPKVVVGGTNGPDAWAVLARDAVTWSSPAPKSGQTSPAPSTLTLADLHDIYSCTVGDVTYDNWAQFGGKNAPIVPVLPLTGSGTRDTFLAALGLGINAPLVPGPCVVNGTTASGLLIAANTGVSTSAYGNTAQFDPHGVPAVDDIFPYSIGDYIAQGKGEGSYSGRAIGGHTTADFAHGVLVLRDVSGVAPTVKDTTAPYSNATVINSTKFTQQLQSILYNVVRNAGTATAPAYPTSPSYEANLSKIFGPAGWACTSTEAKKDIVSYGFLLAGSRSCGALLAGS